VVLGAEEELMQETVEQFTRHELVDYLDGAFDGEGGLVREHAVHALRRNGAPEELTALFAARLREGERVASIRALWRHFGDLAVERSEPT
jgi:hypothetical protein